MGDREVMHEVYIPFTYKMGTVRLSGARKVNLCFVKFDGVEKEYTFYNSSNMLLKKGAKVLVDARGCETKATVVKSINIDRHKLIGFMSGPFYLKNVLGMYITRVIERCW